MESDKTMHRSVRDEYHLLLSADAKICDLTDLPKIENFYETMIENCLDWAENVLGSMVKSEYSKLASNEEKARFPVMHYRLSVQKTYEESGMISIVCEAAQTGRWRAYADSFRRVAHNWEIASQQMIPPKEIFARFTDKKDKRKRMPTQDGLFLKDGKLITFSNANGKKPFSEQVIADFSSHIKR